MQEVDAQSQTSRSGTPAKWLLLLAELRAPFFTASIVPVVLGAALAFYHTGNWHWPLFLWTLFGLIAIHAGANVANDYFDHRSGNDEANTDFVRPFTGGSRMIQRGLLSPREVLALALSCFAIGSGIGLYLAYRTGWPVLALGLIGVAGGFFYTAPPLNLVARGVGEPIIGLHFGVLPVLGAYYVQTGRFSWHVVLMSIPAAILITAVLFINQFQDCRADGLVGKRNWVVRLGRRRSVTVYAAMMLLWAVPIILAPVLSVGPVLCLVALLPLVAAAKAIGTARQHFDAPAQLTPANAMTVIVHLTAGLLLSGGYIAARLLAG